MTYFLTVWEGPAPLSNAHGTSEYQRLLAAPPQEAPTAAIVSFIDALERNHPGRSQPGGDPSPFLDGPLLPHAAGPTITLRVADHAADDVRKLVEETAAELGLVAFDPQLSELIPSATTVARAAEFDLPPAAELPLHLGAVLGEALDAEDTMAGVLEEVASSFYVQWMAQRGQLTIEAQGEALVPEGMALDDTGRQQMRDLGFTEAEPNWSRQWDDGDAAVDQAAQVLTHVLVTVRNLRLGTSMRLQTFPV